MYLNVTITIRRDDALDELRSLIGAIRSRAVGSDKVTVLEAPKDMSYPYPLPVVTISEDQSRHRLYGAEAVEKLRDLAGGTDARPSQLGPQN